MLINLAIIPQQNFDKARKLADGLEKAVLKGDMLEVDSISEKLLATADSSCRISMTEDIWRNFLQHVRQSIPRFEAAYLLSPDVCKQLALLASENEQMDVSALFSNAAGKSCFILQLPVSGD